LVLFWASKKEQYKYGFKIKLLHYKEFILFFFLEKKEAKIQGKKIGSAFFPACALEHPAANWFVNEMLLV
jgi:hypothetical protein